MKAHSPFPSHVLDLDGLAYHYLDEGSGAPVVMLHGNPTWSYIYRNLVRALRDRYRTVVPDHMGCGLSDKPPDTRYDYTLERRVRDLEALLDHLGVTQDITLVLHDWGGMIGMTYAHRHPERIRGLVILNTAAFHLPASKAVPWQFKLCRTPLLGAILVRGFNAFCRGAARACFKQPVDPEVRDAYLAPYPSWSSRIAIHRFVQDIPLEAGHRSYAQVTEVDQGLDRFGEVPMLICWGEQDFVFDLDYLAEWTRRFPRAEVHAFPHAGHYVLEDAGPAIIDRVRTFLKASGGSGTET